MAAFIKSVLSSFIQFYSIQNFIANSTFYSCLINPILILLRVTLSNVNKLNGDVSSVILENKYSEQSGFYSCLQVAEANIMLAL